MDTDWAAMLKAMIASRRPAGPTLEDQAVQLIRAAVAEGRLVEVAESGPVVREAYPGLANRLAEALPGIVVNYHGHLTDALNGIGHGIGPGLEAWQRENPTWRTDVSTAFLNGRLAQVVDGLTLSVTRFAERRAEKA